MHYHIIGIGGSSLAGIARLLAAEGHVVTGTDALTTGNGPNLLPAAAQTVIYTDAVTPGSSGYDELMAARARGLITLRRIEFIAERMRGKMGIAVAGAHGKSTTTAQLGWSLTEAGQDPTVFIGADLPAFGGSARAGAGPFVVTEDCEWNRQFLELSPTVLVITTIDREHLDTYPGGLNEVIAAFREAAQRIQPNGFIVANSDDPNIHAALKDLPQRIVWFGKQSHAQYQLTSAKMINGQLGVGIVTPHNGAVYLTSPLVGVHHATNLAAAYATLAELDCSPAQIAASLTSFPGLKRRFERYRDDAMLAVIDDYAHHPAELAATLHAARTRYPKRRLIAIFQPHLSQRTTDLFDDFVSALALADEILLVDTYEPAGRVHNPSAKTSRDLALALKEAGRTVVEVASADDAIADLEPRLRRADVCITMGATDIWKAAEAIQTWSPTLTEQLNDN